MDRGKKISTKILQNIAFCETAGRNSLCAGESVKGTAGETGRKQDRNKD